MSQPWIEYMRDQVYVKGAAKAVLMCLTSHADKDGAVDEIGYVQLSTEAGVHKTTAIRSVRLLRDFGLIEWDPSGGRFANNYQLMRVPTVA